VTTVLFADRDGAAFGPLGERILPALLPLQAVPVLERALTAMRDAGLRAALLVVGPRAQEVRRRFGTGIRWDIALDFVEREPGESPGDVLRKLEPRLDGDTLVIRGDVNCHGAIGAFLEAVRRRQEPVLCATSGGRPAGLWRFAPGTLKKADLPREPADASWTVRKGDAEVALEDEVVLLDSIASYRAADRSDKPSVSERAEVDPGARLGSGTTVAEDAVVLEGARLTETSVLPGTVIPRGVALENAVVCGNLLVDVASGAVKRLSDLLPAAAPPISKPGLGSRLAGAAAFVLSLPLWPVAFGWAYIANAGHATKPLELSGAAGDGSGRAPFRTFRFETAVPVLRDLPLLLALARGRLALQGVAPVPPGEEASMADWEKTRLEAPPGLLSLSRMAVPASAPPEVTRLVDAFEARRGPAGLVKMGLSALFSSRGWVAPRRWNPDQMPEAGK